jgi:hypothetical protein
LILRGNSPIFIKNIKHMKNLKLLLLTLLSVLSFNLFSQTQVYVTQTSGPNICDGTAVLDTSNVIPTSIFWQGMGMIINQGSYMVTNLCPGTYSVTFNSNGTPVTLTFNITAGNFNPCLNFGGYLTTANSVDSTSCDGVAMATATNGLAPYTYLWSNATTTQTTTNLCPAQYCCYVTDANGCTANICGTIGVQSTNYGDTLYLTSAGMCNNPIGTLSSMIEDCNLNYNAVDSAYIMNITTPQNPLDSVVVTWTLVDTNGVNMVPQYQVYTVVPNTGCYNFQLTVYCYQKSMNYKTIIANETWYMDNVGITELSGYNKKQVIKVLDLMGRQTKVQPNKLLVYVYSDGTTEKVFINE